MQDSGATFVREYYVPKQFLLREDWQDILWDETLREAHQRGVIPVGPIMFTQEEVPSGVTAQQPLIPGVPMEVMPLMAAGLMRVEMVKVTASVMLGAAL